MQCSKCGENNRDGRKYCARCGAALVVTCPYCHISNYVYEDFCGECGKALGSTTEQSSKPIFSSNSGERRQLTVMFCDVVGSTALSQQLDPEDWREILRAYQKSCAQVIHQFDGYIASYSGDGLMVYFGYPRSYEDNARRAVHAGLGVVDAVETLNQNVIVALRVRVGIHTGLVVTGEMGGGKTIASDAIVGETTNICARLEAMATPNTVVISAETQALIEGIFECKNLGKHTLKGVGDATQAYQVCKSPIGRSSFDVRVRRGLTPLIARQAEIDFLCNRWRETINGNGNTVLIPGEAGVGKSRVLRSFRSNLGGQNHYAVYLHCLPFYQNSAYYPILEHIRRIMRSREGDSAEQKLNKLEVLIRRLGLSVSELAPLVGAMLSLPVNKRYTVRQLTAEQIRSKACKAWITVARQVAKRIPLLIVLEDVHWIDPSTLELVSRLIEQLECEHIQLIICYRPEFSPPWLELDDVSTMELKRLAVNESTRMIRQICGQQQLPESLIQQICDKADGVPLFIEELTKTILESSNRQINGGDEHSRLQPRISIPVSLQDSLMARLDRLSAAKGVVMLAAVLGREFTYDMLFTVSKKSRPELDDALAKLVTAEIIFHKDDDREGVFEFKHALLQEAAYHSLLRSTRRQYHLRIAQVLEENFPLVSEEKPELLAHHFTEAEEIAKAIPYWRAAGQRASESSANTEAIAHLTKALELLETQPQSTQQAKLEFGLRVTLIGPLISARTYAAPELEKTFKRALELSDQIEETAEIFPVLHGRYSYYQVTGQINNGIGLGENFLQRIEQHHSADNSVKDLRLIGWRMIGATQALRGQFSQSSATLEQALKLYDASKHQHLAYLYGHDTKSAAMVYYCISEWSLGNAKRALSACDELLQHSESIAHPNSLGVALHCVGIVSVFNQDVSKVGQIALSQLTFANEYVLPLWSVSGNFFQGWVLAERGHLQKGAIQMKQALDDYQKMNIGLTLPLLKILYAAQIGKNSDGKDDALKNLDEAQASIEKDGECWCAAELYRVRGEIMARHCRDTIDKAVENFEKAVSISQTQQAKASELRAILNLFGIDKSDQHENRSLNRLHTIYHAMPKDYETADMAKARQVLENGGVD